METINYFIERTAVAGSLNELLKCSEITQALISIKLRQQNKLIKNIKGAL